MNVTLVYYEDLPEDERDEQVGPAVAKEEVEAAE